MIKNGIYIQMVQRILLILFLCLFPINGICAVTHLDFDDTTSTGTTALSKSTTLSASANYLLVYAGQKGAFGTGFISSVTWNGTNMTKAIEVGDSIDASIDASIWYLANPDTGTHTLTVNYVTSGFSVEWVSLSMSGAGSGAPEATASIQQNLSLSINTLSNGALVMAGVRGNANNTAASNTGDLTTLFIVDNNNGDGHFMSGYAEKSTAGTVNSTWTYGTDSRIAHVAVSVAAGGAVVAPPSAFLYQSNLYQGTLY